MKLQQKTTLLAIFLSGTMALLIIFISLLSFRHFSISTAQEHVQSAAEVVRVSLTESMINGTIDKREHFLKRLAEVNGLLIARVMRSPAVTQQFGHGLSAEQKIDSVEKQVMESGKPFFGMLDEEEQPIFRGTIPYIATQYGEPNCLQCHSTTNGTVLGAITIQISMAQLKQKALITIAFMVVVIIVFSFLLILFFRRQMAPVVTTATEVQQVVALAKDGNFTGRIQYFGTDEIGEISQNLNRLMNHLQENLGTITHDVSQLLRYEADGNTNLITTTTEMVEMLLEIAQFKQSVEEDRTKAEVYARIGHVLRDQFGIQYFTIYEISNPGMNHIKPIIVDNELDSSCKWCNSEVLFQADLCRAHRTGRIIDSLENPSICNQFKGMKNHDVIHICMPVFHSGMVGTVVQLVIDRNNGRLYQLLLPFILAYLRESAPTVEAKRLLDTLRESALRDALTGLHNRRFLEEYTCTLEATTKRKKNRLSVLLMDIDHFKAVNDVFGHDVGDTVLRVVAKALATQIRTSDMVIRYGGEEFLVILQESDEYSGERMAEKLRVAVEALKIPVSSGIMRKTISIGVAGFPSDGEDIWQTIKCADLALYSAKHSGRNRVVTYTPELKEKS
ncbi:MAG: diguanylate cyclase [Magnetococcales bacterium]|nr:diguanylate cyclase [Magnetococcales bacterium]MBF0439420.1 diguanylate cyclase [Magnetococcales bacterium]